MPYNMKEYIYIYILFLISVASVCYGSSAVVLEKQKAAITQPTERGVPLNAKGSGTMGVRNVAKAAGTQTEGRGIRPAIMTSLLQGAMELCSVVIALRNVETQAVKRVKR